jgi:serine/threonine protein kinase
VPTAAHQRGLIHRDIKLSNIWLETLSGRAGQLAAAERVKILDFGLARALCDDNRLTLDGGLVGTPAYMAPEQVRDENIDARSDLFSLGCVLYRLCTGRSPFKETNLTATLSAVLHDQPKPPTEWNSDLPPALSELIVRLLAKQPEKRPASAQVVIEALTAIERGLVERQQPTLPSRPRSRRRWVALLAVGVLFLSGALIAPQVILRIKGPKGTTDIQLPPGSTVVEVKPDVREVPLRVEEAGPKKPPEAALGDRRPLSPLALVSRPAPLAGVQSWSVEMLRHSAGCWPVRCKRS